jgi:hypothetical protein
MPGKRRSAAADETIHRTHKFRRFVMIDNAVFENRSLSWEARGLLGYILTKPDHWIVRVGDLVAHGPARREKLRATMQELELAGYLRRRRIRVEGGRISWLTEVYERPQAR